MARKKAKDTLTLVLGDSTVVIMNQYNSYIFRTSLNNGWAKEVGEFLEVSGYEGGLAVIMSPHARHTLFNARMFTARSLELTRIQKEFNDVAGPKAQKLSDGPPVTVQGLSYMKTADKSY